jgi:hypothetical protein
VSGNYLGVSPDLGLVKQGTLNCRLERSLSSHSLIISWLQYASIANTAGIGAHFVYILHDLRTVQLMKRGLIPNSHHASGGEF